MDIDSIMNPAPERAVGTRDQIVAALGIIVAVGDAIRDLGSVPSGELYAHVMGKLDIHQYNAVIEKLKQAKLVSEENHLLTWIGPKKGATR